MCRPAQEPQWQETCQWPEEACQWPQCQWPAAYQWQEACQWEEPQWQAQERQNWPQAQEQLCPQ